MKAVAHQLIEMGARAIVVTGGHLERPVDVFADGSGLQALAGDPVKRLNIHGAGCTFSSALAANLGQGHQMAEAVVLAKAYVTATIKNAYAVGPGRVPLNHFYHMREAHPAAHHSAVAVDTLRS
jgi:hydroxymethylpyrimidine/phosphomethylpyrimidine kinase